jgi:hypothetical protein
LLTRKRVKESCYLQTEYSNCFVASQYLEYQQEIQKIVCELAETLLCRIPDYFGDCSPSAIRNIINELVVEHSQRDRASINELETQLSQKETELQQFKQSLLQQESKVII